MSTESLDAETQRILDEVERLTIEACSKPLRSRTFEQMEQYLMHCRAGLRFVVDREKSDLQTIVGRWEVTDPLMVNLFLLADNARK